MIYLDKNTDSILPYGLLSTPFEVVYKALQAVAGDVWAVDPSVYRAAIAWGYYLQERPDVLVNLDAGRQYIVNILLGEQIPLIKATQTTAELVDLLAKWRDYMPTFPKLEDLYTPYAARVNIKPITDAPSQAILPVSDIHGAFYVVIEDIDWTRPLTLEEAVTIAERATPMGSRPYAFYLFDESVDALASLVYGDSCTYLEEPPVAAVPVLDYIVVDNLGNIITGSSSVFVISHISNMFIEGVPMSTFSTNYVVLPDSGYVVIEEISQ